MQINPVGKYYNGFLEWFSEKEKVLKENGFHKLRG